MNNKNISMLSDPQRFQAMQHAYLAARRCEGWLIGDTELLHLPRVPACHPHARIWRWWQHSLKRLTYHHHLKQTVMDCGGEGLNNTLMYKLLQKMRLRSPFPWIRIVV